MATTVEFWSMTQAAGVEVEDFIEFFRDPPEAVTSELPVVPGEHLQ